MTVTAFNIAELRKFLAQENDRVRDLLLLHKVPEAIDDIDVDDYLIEKGSAQKMPQFSARAAPTTEEVQARLEAIKNKRESKNTNKGPLTERQKKKREAKLLKNNKQAQKLVTAEKALKNRDSKASKVKKPAPEMADEAANEAQAETSASAPSKEAKLLFPKLDFASHPGAKVKQSHQHPREILKKIKETDKKIKELKEQGDIEQASAIQSDLAWKKAFDKIEGKKVKDDPKLLYKALKKRKVEKKKAKTKWNERKERVEAGINKRQKKRQDNLEKRSKDKTQRKLKKLTKKGRVIPGF